MYNNLLHNIAGITYSHGRCIVFCDFYSPTFLCGRIAFRQFPVMLSLSCLTFFMIMVLGKYLDFSIYIVLITFFLSEMIVYGMYPVENVNRMVDAEENKQFKRKLQQFLLLDGILAVIFAALNQGKYLQTITLTLAMITVTMVIGKYKNKIGK